MRVAVRSVVIVALAAGVLACSSDSLMRSEDIASHLVGTWCEPFDTPGNSLILMLSAHDSTVTGTGGYAGEAGPSGTLTVDGMVTGATIDLEMLYDSGRRMHFRGNLSAFSRLNGIWFSEPVGDPVGIELDKVR